MSIQNVRWPVFPALLILYDSETWATYKRQEWCLNTFYMRCLVHVKYWTWIKHHCDSSMIAAVSKVGLMPLMSHLLMALIVSLLCDQKMIFSMFFTLIDGKWKEIKHQGVKMGYCRCQYFGQLWVYFVSKTSG